MKSIIANELKYTNEITKYKKKYEKRSVHTYSMDTMPKSSDVSSSDFESRRKNTLTPVSSFNQISKVISKALLKEQSIKNSDINRYSFGSKLEDIIEHHTGAKFYGKESEMKIYDQENQFIGDDKENVRQSKAY